MPANLIRKTSADFEVGQLVRCPEPAQFLSATAAYLANRVGLVDEVAPVTRPNPQFCGHLNKVWVTWQKRGGRGETRRMAMDPRSIEAMPAEPATAKPPPCST